MSKHIAEMIECEICVHRFTPATGGHAPRLLPNCGHTFCTRCVSKLMKHKAEGPPRCPTCRKPMTSSKIAAENLPLNMMAVQLLDADVGQVATTGICCYSCNKLTAVYRCQDDDVCQQTFCARCYRAHKSKYQKLKLAQEQKSALDSKLKLACENMETARKQLKTAQSDPKIKNYRNKVAHTTAQLEQARHDLVVCSAKVKHVQKLKNLAAEQLGRSKERFKNAANCNPSELESASVELDCDTNEMEKLENDYQCAMTDEKYAQEMVQKLALHVQRMNSELSKVIGVQQTRYEQATGAVQKLTEKIDEAEKHLHVVAAQLCSK